MNESPWVCPITALPMNGVNVFFVNWTCGCVFSEKAHHELKTNTCYGCGAEMEESKLIKLYPEDELLRIYELRIVEDIAQRKQKKTEEKVVERKRKSTLGGNGSNQLKKSKVESIDKQFSSIQDNPNVPSAVKAMFTTSEEAKKQPKAHWVTHNPLYY